MREHIKAFLLASSLAFGIPTFVDAEPLERGVRYLPRPGARDARAASRTPKRGRCPSWR